MTKKYKIITAVIVSTLVLVVAGLTVGLVLVAQQVQMTNSVTVTYNATNVDCDITIWAVHYVAPTSYDIMSYTNVPLTEADLLPPAANTAEKEIVRIVPQGETDESKWLNSITHEIHAHENEGTDILWDEYEVTTTSRTLSFEDVTLQPVEKLGVTEPASISSYVVFFFQITNTSGESISGGVEVISEEISNIAYAQGRISESDDQGYELDTSSDRISLSNNETRLYGVVFQVEDISSDADLNANISLTLLHDYAIEV
ncbi:MAG: hypothetical protein IJA61_02120 [Clostridia bacterium]|nr:hypothetical protein [Clostridia bacterium]